MRLWSFLKRREVISPSQLALDLEAPPATADDLFDRLRQRGLRDIDRLSLTRNRTVMVSFRNRELRVHEGYLAAPPTVLDAIVTFVNARQRRHRRAAGDVITAFRVDRTAPARQPDRTHPDDEPMAERLSVMHAQYNTERFGGSLSAIPVRVSRRMKTRLGHYAARNPSGDPPEIVISRRHVRRHGWDEALHTLLHEMVHQWQDETGRPLDHGREFRRKCREVGITPRATRDLRTASRTGRTPVNLNG